MSTILRFMLTTTTLALAACGGSETPPASGEAEQPTSTTQQPSQAGIGGSTGTRTGIGSSPQAGATSPTRTTTAGTAASAGAGAGGSSAAAGGAGAGATAAAGDQGGAGQAAAGASGSAGAAGSPEAGAGGATATSSAKPPATTLMLEIAKEHFSEAPVFNVHYPTTMPEGVTKLPIVVWANGGCVNSDFTWVPLFERWAKGGFVVLSLSNNAPEDDLNAQLSMLAMTTKVEHAQLIDEAAKLDASGPLAGKLDLERVVVSGNSCGGVTSLEVAAEDERTTAVFVLSGSSAVGSTNNTVMKAITVPVGYIVGSESEDIAAPNALMDYDAMNEGVPAMVVSRRAGDHMTVSTEPEIAPEVAEIALNWMDLALYGTKAAFDELSSMNRCANCTPGDWMMKSKHIETLQK